MLDLTITSWPYFRVKLSCVCLKFTYKKKSKDKNTIVIYDKMIYYWLDLKKLNTKRKGDIRLPNWKQIETSGWVEGGNQL